jgi:hypothetical protein
MAAMGKDHPLNIFRQQAIGFDTATRERRTLPGKIVASAPRARPMAPLVAAARKERAATTGRPRTNRLLLYSVLVVAAGLVLYVAGAAAGAPALKSETVFSTAAATGDFTILAADYTGTEANHNHALAVRDMLRGRGLPDVRVLGYPPVKDGVHSRYTVLVGNGRTAGALKDVLGRLRAITGPIGDPAPFRDAKLIETPAAP